MKLNGKTVVKGIAIGKICKINQDIDEYVKKYQRHSVDEESRKVKQAVVDICDYLNEMLNKNSEMTVVEIEIMNTHLLMLSDPALAEMIHNNIENGDSAPTAVEKAKIEMCSYFEGIEDSYLKERMLDIEDVSNRIIHKLLGIKRIEFQGVSNIIVANDIEPSMIASFSKKKIAGLVLENGSTTSHAIIIARAKGIPTLVGIDFEGVELKEADKVILDGHNKMIIKPTEDLINTFLRKREIEEKLNACYIKHAKEKAITKDYKTITVAGNISKPSDVEQFSEYGVEGVGLFRSEFLFMDRPTLPTEEEQFIAYKQAVEGADGYLCIVRTLDIGGDKPLPVLMQENEKNPFLGYRAIRICLEEPELFRTQLRAIIRASAFGKMAILIPMIINVDEILRTKAIIEEIKEELLSSGITYDSDIEIGIMVETPASAIMADTFAKYVDFFSIGTNDLVQYTLAVDRGNQKIAKLYNYFNPAVIKLIKMVIDAAHRKNKWVGVCGEMASDENALLALLEFGVDEISMGPLSVPKCKAVVRDFGKNFVDGKKLLEMETPEEVEAYLTDLAKKMNNDK
jgi:phosphotransferase system enzyme I (PtsI)